LKLKQKRGERMKSQASGRDNRATGMKTALVTGASSGFGLLASVALAKSGFRVIAAMRDPDRRAPLLKEAEQAGVVGQIDILKLDVTQHEQIAEAVAQVIGTYGKIDVLINNAGFAAGGFVEEVPLTEWYELMETNFFGLVAVTKAVLPHMRERRSGTIINVSSVSGRIGFPGYGPYAASKFAVEGFSETLRLEMLPHGVHVALVEPGAFKTNIWEKGFARLRFDPSSPYRDMMEAVLAYSRKTAETAADPLEVAETIVRIAQAEEPPFRHMAGRGVRLTMLMKQLLPWRWLERAILRQLRRK
jgi:NAD(P)-dependent dehydrogenase (short-subunit alcohol dehydrogenase family)